MKRLLISFAFICGSLSIQAADKDSAYFYFNKGLQERQEGRYMSATRLFETALQYDETYVDALLENATCYLEMKKPERARVCLEKAISIQPDNQKIMVELMNIYFNGKQYQRSLELASKVKTGVNTDRIKGLCLYQMEDLAEAEKYLKKSLAAEPQDAEVNYILARTYLDMEDYHSAVPYYEAAIKLDDSRHQRIYELGILYYTVNNYAKAYEMILLAGTKGYPASNDYNENLGLVSLYAGEYERGEELLMAVWKRKPNNKDILRNLAEVLYSKGQYDRSLVYCQKLLELDAKDGKALYQAGLNFQKSGQKERGQKMCDMAIEMDSSLAGLRRKKEIM
jgi:Tfp pilus assembly protein PilF